jgi:hypothetical protein
MGRLCRVGRDDKDIDTVVNALVIPTSCGSRGDRLRAADRWG